MSINLLNAGLFLLAAIVLLGSPGPAIAALVAIGKEEGLVRGLRFYTGLQIGLAIAAGISMAGLFSAISAIPAATTTLAILATLYLIYLAYKIATAPVGHEIGNRGANLASTLPGGFLLGLTNPKAYMAFISLMASYSIIESNKSVDITLKWSLCVVTMIVVDLIWLWIGALVQKAQLKPRTERVINVIMGMTILLTALLGLMEPPVS